MQPSPLVCHCCHPHAFNLECDLCLLIHWPKSSLRFALRGTSPVQTWPLRSHGVEPVPGSPAAVLSLGWSLSVPTLVLPGTRQDRIFLLGPSDAWLHRQLIATCGRSHLCKLTACPKCCRQDMSSVEESIKSRGKKHNFGYWDLRRSA